MTEAFTDSEKELAQWLDVEIAKNEERVEKDFFDDTAVHLEKKNIL